MTRPHDEHMERVRAVQRRSAYERVLAKIVFYRAMERTAEAGLPDECLEHLGYLCELRDSLRQEMIVAGQITADA